MARIDSINPANTAGEWYVDTRCIDCDTCRQIDGGVFVRRGGLSVVGSQPSTAADVHRAWLAATACPTQSIGTRTRLPRPHGLYPLELTDGVYACGYNSPHSYGAHSFLVVRPDGNLLVDSPRWSRELAERIDDLGGVAHVLLTHQDDVADSHRYADRYGARVWIHEDDARAAPFATDVMRGSEDVAVAAGVVSVAVPGHTRGSVAFVIDERFLFSGDSLYWHDARGDLAGHRGATWYSWRIQGESLARLARTHRFEWVFAGHGGRGWRPAGEMHDRLTALAARMTT